MTLYPAQILGLDDVLGSIAPNKSASFVLTDGDLLEPGTNIEQVWIDGVKPSMDDVQKAAYRKWGARPQRPAVNLDSLVPDRMRTCRWLLLAVALWQAHAWSATRPNLLLIVTDNQSPGLLGAYGNPDILTPNIDQLAADGLLFEQAYATSGVCSPTRATLLTGLLPSQTGVHNGLPGRFKVPNWSAIEEFRNLPQTLADAGYRTGMVGKYHLGAHAKAQLGFDFWATFRAGHTESFVDVEVTDNGKTLNIADLDVHITDYWTQRSVDFVEQQTADQPFFLMVSYNGPYILPPTVNEPPANRHADYYAANPPAMPQFPVHPYLREWAKVTRMKVDVAGGTYPWAAIDALNNQQAMNKIASEMTMVDDGIGDVLDALGTQRSGRQHVSRISVRPGIGLRPTRPVGQ